MFKELGMLANMLGNKSKLQEEMTKFQETVAQVVAEGTAGAGYVTVKVNGKMEIQSVRISEEALALGDREMLEDLITAATNQALTNVRERVAQESMKLAQSMGLPPGMMGGIPGLG